MEGGESRDAKVVIGMQENLERALCLSPQHTAQMHDCPGSKQEISRMKHYSFSGLDLFKRPLWSVLSLKANLISVVCFPRPY